MHQDADGMIREPGRVHPTFDFELWKQRIELRYLDAPGGEWVDSPSRLVRMEARRSLAFSRAGRTPEGLDIDVFVWELHEQGLQSNRTRIGGLPWRDSGKRWPVGADGAPLTFVAQICFADSWDVLRRKLPGDVLLLFGEDIEGSGNYLSRIHGEWAGLTVDRPMTIDEAPAECLLPYTFSGVRHRTRQYCFEDSEGIFDERSVYDAIWQATIIGRVAFIPQGETYDGLIATLSSVLPGDDWPFINVPSPPFEELPGGRRWPVSGWNEFGIGDAGAIAIRIDESGRVLATESYT